MDAGYLQIKQSFCYDDSLQLYSEFYPMLKTVYRQIIEQQKSNPPPADGMCIENEQDDSRPKQIQDVDFIPIPQDPQPQPKPKQDIRLQLENQVQDLKPLSAQYDINLKRKGR